MKFTYFTLFNILFISALNAQSFWVGIDQNQETIDASHLDPPYTAGANYANAIPLSAEANLILSGIDENTPWCLYVQRMSMPPGQATLALLPNYNNLLPQQWDPNSPVQCPLETLPNPCFSGIGPIESLNINFLLENASLPTDWQLRTEEILWTVSSGGCPSGP